MVKIEKDRLIITLDHPCPEEFIKHLQNEIIVSIQGEPKDKDHGYFLLELLKQTMDLDI